MEKLTLLVTRTENMEKKTEDFTVISLTFPMFPEDLDKRLKSIEAINTTIISHKMEGFLDFLEIPPYANLYGLNTLMTFVAEELDEDFQSAFIACMEYWKNSSYNNIIQKFKSQKYRFFDDIFGAFELGENLVNNEIDNYFVSADLVEYLDFEQIGQDHMAKKHGKFTDTGYIEEI